MSSPTALRADYSAERIAFYRAGLPLPLVTQNAAANKRPFIHPILAPDGVGELTENEPGHHLWQHGLYVGLNDLNGVGFWTEGLSAGSTARDGTFHPQPLAPPVVHENQARWRVVTQWRSPDGVPMLIETQNWTLQDKNEILVLNMDWELKAKIDLRFGKYGYGGLFLRMPWRKETQGQVLTSEGHRTQEAAEGQRARWVALSMPLPGRADTKGPAGMAMLDHPQNPDYPAPWRVDNNLGIAPSRCITGEWNLARGTATRSRYRVLAYLGGIDRDIVEAEWRQFSEK